MNISNTSNTRGKKYNYVKDKTVPEWNKTLKVAHHHGLESVNDC